MNVASFSRDEAAVTLNVAEAFLARLHGVRRNGSGWMALCPAHEDRHPSFSIHVRKGKILLRCFAGCSIAAICAATGIGMRDLFSDHSSPNEPLAIYSYVDEVGALLFQVLRYPGKKFKQRRPYGPGGWIWNLGAVRRVLYRLPEVVKAKSVLIVEGEKDCDTASAMNLVATCNPHGAAVKWHKEYSESLRGKRVAIIADSDDPGRRHAQQVAASLAGKVASLRVLELPGAKDLSEWVERGGTQEKLLGLIDDAPQWKPDDAAPPENRADLETPAAAESQEEQGRKEMERQIESLSMLDHIGYDRVREQKAKELGIRVSTLDAEVQARRNTRGTNEPDGQGQTVFLSDPQPWESEVSGDALLRELEGLFLAYLTMPKGAAETFALWTAFSYAHDAFQISPLLAITSPEKGCGKSTVLTLLSALVRKPLSSSNITSSALFRAVERFSPTLLIDEADTFTSEDEQLRGVINSGWWRSQAQVIRNVGDDHEPRLFSTWGPKAIATIGNLPGTWADRSVEVRMCRQTPEEERAKRKLRTDRLMSELEHLRRRTWRWVRDNLEVLRRSDPEVPEGFANRLADNWRPLFAIADLAGGEWPRRAREAATMLSGAQTDESFGVMLLEDLKSLFTEQKVDRLSSAAIVEALGEMDDRPWPEYSRGKPITKHALAKILTRFRVHPASVRIGSKTLKGYLLQDLEESFLRFSLQPRFQAVTTEQAAPDAGSVRFQSGTEEEPVPVQNSLKPASNGPCSVVTVADPGEKGKRVLEGEI